MHDFGYPYVNTQPEASIAPQQANVTVEAPKWLDDNHIHYRLLYATPTQVRAYALDRWIASPSELFEQLLNNSSKQWPTPMAIKLQVFEQQFDAPNQAKVVMHFTAATLPEDNKQHLLKKDFHLQLPCPTPDANGAVTGFNLLIKDALEKIQTWQTSTK
jgi:cholesterol transport system auxiliary component